MAALPVRPFAGAPWQPSMLVVHLHREEPWCVSSGGSSPSSRAASCCSERPWSGPDRSASPAHRSRRPWGRRAHRSRTPRRYLCGSGLDSYQRAASQPAA